MAGSNVSGQIANSAAAVTLSDTADNSYSYLWVGTGGTVKVTTENGDAVSFTNVPSGSYLWVRTRLIWSTGSTASGIVGHK